MLASHTCWEVIPDSGKIVIIDTGISVKSAFSAMMENGTCVSSYYIPALTANAFRNSMCASMGLSEEGI